ncbi:MAG: hypothetical protein ACI9P5_004426 [Saprospiraceae bacterium]|jgi:hypothetical protein
MPYVQVKLNNYTVFYITHFLRWLHTEIYLSVEVMILYFMLRLKVSDLLARNHFSRCPKGLYIGWFKIGNIFELIDNKRVMC